jgi:hypothetical protein
MSSAMKTYGVTLQALTTAGADVPLDKLTGSASIEEIEAAINLMTPVGAGRELIRLGGAKDGGYLVPNDLLEIEACFSPGTNNFKRFEDQILSAYGIKSFMCDFSSDVDKFQTPLAPDSQFFEKKWLDIDGASDSIEINEWVESNTEAASDLILQMDIEGAEYRNLIATRRSTMSRFRIIILELHGLGALGDREFLNGVFLPAMLNVTHDHVCVHAHANNCCGAVDFSDDLVVPQLIELTFLRRDRLGSDHHQRTLPHRLDEDNVTRKAPIQLGGLWLSEADELKSRLLALERSVGWLNDRTTELMRYNEFLVGRTTLTGNVALNKRAKQSSSFADGDAIPNGATNGVKTGRYGFHTAFENRPWWLLDLEAVFPIDKCLLFNRLDCGSERADNIQLLTSVDGRSFTHRYSHTGSTTFGGISTGVYEGGPPLLVDLNGAHARYIRLEINGYGALHLDEVEVYPTT